MRKKWKRHGGIRQRTCGRENKGNLWGMRDVEKLFIIRKERYRHLAERLEHLTANAKVATVLGSLPASSDTVESEGRQMKQC